MRGIRSFHTVSALPGMSEANRKSVLEGYSRGLHGLIDTLLNGSRRNEEAGKQEASARGGITIEIRLDLERIAGQRRPLAVTFKGTFREAQKELSRLLAAADAGTLVVRQT